MKIRHPWLIRAASWLGAQAVRGWMRTVTFDCRSLGPDLDPCRDGILGRYIYAFWHENLLLPLSQYARPDIRVLISRHADGQLIAELAGHLGFGLVRGSTSRGSSRRGGFEAVREMLRLGQQAHLAVTPDGPRGPRRMVQPGLLYVASRTGLPIVLLGIGYRRPWRVGSWDRFAVPKPGSYMTCVFSEPIPVPADADRDELEHYRQKVERALLHVGELAERWAETGNWPADAAA